MATSDPPGDAPGAPELTARALAAGLAIGALIAVGNVYMGLKTGWWDSGSITASLLAFAGLSAWAGVSGRRATALETNLAQTAAVAVGAAPAAAGLLGAIPALALLGRDTPGWVAGAWGLGVGALGVLLALALRRRLVEEERLPFPTGVATAGVIRAAHGGERSGTRLLAGVGGASAALTAARDVAGWWPAVTAWPGTVAGAPAAALGLGIAWSPMMAGAGLVAGLHNGLGVLAGSVVAWALVAPALLRSGAVPEAAYGPLVGWLAWPGVALMLGSASVALAGQARTLPRALGDLARLRGGGRSALWLGGAAVAGIAVVGAAGFGLRPWQVAAALALAAVLGGVSARAAGQTDMIPAGEVGQLAQVAGGVVSRTTLASNAGMGAVVAGTASQAGVSLWALKAGSDLGASPRRQALALLAGTAVGAAVAVPAYLLLARSQGLGTAALPVPGALPWKAIAETAAGGLAAMPPGAGVAAAVAFAAGAALELLGRTRAARFLPAAGAVGMGFIAPAHYAAAIAAGALAGAAWRALRPARAGALVPLVGAGAIAGESIAGVAVAAWSVLGPGR
nr:OPT/YSL family transporter [Anaeromyxobacter diazotrophicus]